jgi:hypothetical protein
MPLSSEREAAIRSGVELLKNLDWGAHCDLRDVLAELDITRQELDASRATVAKLRERIANLRGSLIHLQKQEPRGVVGSASAALSIDDEAIRKENP